MLTNIKLHLNQLSIPGESLAARYAGARYRAAARRFRNIVLQVSEQFKSYEICTPDRSVSTYQRLEEPKLFHAEDPVFQEHLKYRQVGPKYRAVQSAVSRDTDKVAAQLGRSETLVTNSQVRGGTNAKPRSSNGGSTVLKATYRTIRHTVSNKWYFSPA